MTEEKVTKKEPYRITTLQELGSNLPIIPLGPDKNPLENRSFSFIEWDMETEEILSDLQKDSNNVGEFVNKMMGILIADFCGKDFQKLSKEEKTLTISQREFTNVMYMYIYLRVEEMGNELKFEQINCPACTRIIKNFIADLNTLEIHVKDKEHDRKAQYELIKPIIMPDGKIITKLDLDVSKWSALESADSEIAENAGKMKRVLFESSLCGVHDKDKPLEGFVDTKTVIKKLKKVDIEKCMFQLVKNNAGPEMNMKGRCPHCKVEFFKTLDWRYDYFFDSSSL